MVSFNPEPRKQEDKVSQRAFNYQLHKDLQIAAHVIDGWGELCRDKIHASVCGGSSLIFGKGLGRGEHTHQPARDESD